MDILLSSGDTKGVKTRFLDSEPRRRGRQGCWQLRGSVLSAVRGIVEVLGEPRSMGMGSQGRLSREVEAPAKLPKIRN